MRYTDNPLASITDFAIAGHLPAGVRPEIMSRLTDIVAAWPSRRKAPRLNTRYKFAAMQSGQVICMTDDIFTALRMGSQVTALGGNDDPL